MPLDSIITEILRLSERQGSTPVLVTPTYLSFRDEFFVALAEAIGRQTSRRVRLDLYREMPSPLSLVSDRLAWYRVRRLNRRLSKRFPNLSEPPYMQITATVGRPGGPKRDLVVGLSGSGLELPNWTTPIRLGATPSEVNALQSDAKSVA